MHRRHARCDGLVVKEAPLRHRGANDCRRHRVEASRCAEDTAIAGEYGDQALLRSDRVREPFGPGRDRFALYRDLADREDMRKVTAPTLLICREGDVIHPAVVGHILAEIMPNAELMSFEDGMQMYAAIPELVQRVGRFLVEP